jgi:hypothetical protein
VTPDATAAYATFRPRRGALVARVAALGSLVAFAVLAFVVPEGGAAGFGLPDRLLTFGFGVAVAAFLWRYARLRAVPSRTGLRVVNLVRSHDLEWAEILSVGFSGGAPWVVLELADTEEVSVMAIQRADGAFADKEAARLAALVAHHGSARG